ncbi:hypothetical protein SS50377_28131 [Spironucleus salmonicida]|uniref:Dynein assembly factor 3 C-terminal domain-containing protein n=1 Tax=Spironucleus salmonicida TaxID=348837 RepID=V6LE85_9EUKA|nr:hypothetical protein SS50377_28131 [Spironucleus salmonicida]|eukprot:EST42815.1 hypothetical protein SS50377_17584 [Spironucleus salmonicida]
MQPMQFGSLQHWGLAPPITLPESTNTEYILFAEHGDLRYLFKNINSLNNVVFYERSPRLLAKIIVKLALIQRIYAAETINEKIELAHYYQEINCNIRISEGAQVLLFDIIPDCLASMVTSKKQSVTSEFLQQKIDFSFLKSTQKDDIYKEIQLFSKKHLNCEVEKSFDMRLRDSLQDRYDSRYRVCLWGYHFDLHCRIPFTHEIFYKSFKTEGIGHIRAYFRLPESLGAKEKPGAVGRRAASSEESKMYCGIDNPFFGLKYDADQELGPWMELCYDVYNEENRKEFESSFSPQGSESFETTYTSVELSVVNLIYLSNKIVHNDYHIMLLQNNFLEKAKFENYFSGVVLSIESLRFAQQDDFKKILTRNAFVVGELAEFIPEFKNRKEFAEKVISILGNGEKKCCGGPFKGKLKEQENVFSLGDTHIFSFYE